MKKLLSTLALVLAISSVSMAKSSNKKNHHKKASVKVTFYCDDVGHITGGVTTSGTVFGMGTYGKEC